MLPIGRITYRSEKKKKNENAWLTKKYIFSISNVFKALAKQKI